MCDVLDRVEARGVAIGEKRGVKININKRLLHRFPGYLEKTEGREPPHTVPYGKKIFRSGSGIESCIRSTSSSADTGSSASSHSRDMAMVP